MVIITIYRLVEHGGFPFVQSGESSICPICSEMLTMRSWRARMLIDSCGSKVVYQIRRLLCSKCNKIHHELPDCMIPYKRHCTETIGKIALGAVNSISNDAPCEENTIFRIRLWWGAVLPYFLNIMETLSQKYRLDLNIDHQHNINPGRQLTNNYISSMRAFKKIMRAIVNSGNWISSSMLCT